MLLKVPKRLKKQKPKQNRPQRRLKQRELRQKPQKPKQKPQKPKQKPRPQKLKGMVGDKGFDPLGLSYRRDGRSPPSDWGTSSSRHS